MENLVNERIKMLRKSMKISQAKFASRANITQLTVSRIENNATEPSNDTLEKLVENLGVNMEWLLSGNGEMFAEGGAKIAKARESINPWENALIQQLKEENNRLAKLVDYFMLATTPKAQKSFNFGADVAGFLTEKLISSVRVSA